MSAIYLLVKKHSFTGMLYFCKTTKSNYLKYKGSGKYWKRHLSKHGDYVETIKVWRFEDAEKAKRFALRFSSYYKITSSDKWANLIPENAHDGAPEGHENFFTQGHTEETKNKIRNSKIGVSRPSWIIEKMTEVRHSKPISEVENKKRSESLKRYFSENPKHLEEIKRRNTGKIRTEEQKAKYKAASNVLKICEHCGKEVKAPTYNRYHGKNCKMK